MNRLTFWHATPSDNVDSILCDGLEPRIGPRSKVLGEPVPAIYFFDSRELLEDAIGQWLGDSFEEEGITSLAVISIVIGEAELAGHLHFDGLSHFCTCTIPPAALRVLWHECLTE